MSESCLKSTAGSYGVTGVLPVTDLGAPLGRRKIHKSNLRGIGVPPVTDLVAPLGRAGENEASLGDSGSVFLMQAR
jgi:hypothetical protein